MIIENVVQMSADQYFFMVEGVRNAFDSWDRADSKIDLKTNMLTIGPNDHKMLTKLFETRHAEERKFLRMVPIGLRISAPLYWWKQFDTYKIGTVSLSCSTMHTITKKRFEEEDFDWDGCVENDMLREHMVNLLNTLRERYLETEDKDVKKLYWNTIIALLPENYIQTRNIWLNAEVLNNMIRQRSHHKLANWHDFCDIVSEIPFVTSIPEKMEVH